MSDKNLPVYCGISRKEFTALGAVSGQAFRLYVAITLFAMGQKTTCFPSWSRIKEIMGKPDYSTRQLQKLAVQLEEHGFIKRGKPGISGNPRFRLLLKERVQNERGERTKTTPKSEQKGQEGASKKTTHNNKKNNKKNNKNNIISQKSKTYKNGKTITYRVLPTDRIEKAEILHTLETTRRTALLNHYDPEDILEWLEELQKSRHTFPKSKAKMTKFLQDWDIDEF